MRVLLSAYACEPGRGSEPGCGWNWAIALAEQGHDVTVLTRPLGRKAIEEFLIDKPGLRIRFLYVEVSSPLVDRLPGVAHVYGHYLAWQWQAFTVCRDMAGAFDIVHHVTWGSIAGGTHLWRLGVPLVFGPVGGGQTAPPTLRHLLQHDRLRYLIRDAYLRLGLFAARPSYLRKAEIVLATNYETIAQARSMGARRTALFLDTGLPDRFVVAAPTASRVNRPLRVLWVGRLIPRKGVVLALHALARTQESMTLTIVGDGPQRDLAIELSRTLGISDRVRHVPLVPYEEMPSWYRSHDVFLFTSVLDSFGSQLLEAMGSGIPVVTLDHQGAKAFVPNDAGKRVPIGTLDETAKAIAHALDDLARDSGKRIRMGSIGWEIARSETWPDRARRMTAIYESLAR